MNQAQRQLITDTEQYLINIRRRIHRRPELSCKEYETCALICSELESMGIAYKRVGETGVLGIIEGAAAGKRLAIRADIDALPVTETTDLTFASEIPGVMHACGHDAHCALLLASAKCLSKLRADLCGTVFLCFQSGEEVGAGAEEMVAALHELGGVELVYSIHVFAALPPRTIIIADGPVLAGVAEWDITVTGRGGHGSMPDIAINPLLPAAEMVGAISCIPVNRQPAQEVCVVSPCILNCGTAPNIIAGTAHVAGTMRYFRYEDFELISGHITRIAENIAAAHGASATVKFQAHPTAPTVNDPKSCAFARQTLAELGSLMLIPGGKPALGSDNYSAFLREFPGFYGFVGVRSSRPGASPLQHNSAFEVDESALQPTLEFMVAHALRFVGHNA